jgi:subtilase-type serine protease
MKDMSPAAPPTCRAVGSHEMPQPPSSRRPDGFGAGIGRKAVSGMLRRPLKTAVFAGALFAFLLCQAFALPAMGADADDFRTDEYLISNGLDAVYAAEAYALGYSGKGVTVAVVDSAALRTHPEFIAKGPYYVEYFTDPDDGEYHGIHVAGTIAASRDGVEMHGVAYAAGLVTMVAIGGKPTDPEYEDPTLEAFKTLTEEKYKNVSIVNNSWGIDQSLASYARGEDISAVTVPTLEEITGLLTLHGKTGALFVFASGNEGYSSPGFAASVPSLVTGATFIDMKTIDEWTSDSNFLHDKYDTSQAEELRALSLAFVSVSAFDSGDPDNEAPKSNQINFFPTFSNLTDGAAHYSLLAPGVNIYSTVLEDGYNSSSGTSMAAPHVSGVAALVKEAFPWMNGKQLADTLLSTAAHLNDMDGLPPFLIQCLDETIDDVVHFLGFSITVPQSLVDSHGGNISGITKALLGEYDYEEIKERMYEASTYSEKTVTPLDDPLTPEEFTKLLEEALDSSTTYNNGNPDVHKDGSDNWVSVHVVENKEYMKLFGMGVVNAASAVGGPGWLDANRLDDKDLVTEYKETFGFGTDEGFAMYPVDTNGYDSVWVNDILQVKVGDSEYPISNPNSDPDLHGAPVPGKNSFNEALDGLAVGLLKTGVGKLTLTGNNKFEGPTVIEGGEIALVQSNDDYGTLAGDVGIYSGGVLSGNGIVKGNVYSSGTIVPGLADSPGSSLEIKGDLETDGGIFLIYVSPTGVPNTLKVGKNATLDNTAFEFTSLEGGAALPVSYDIVQADGRLIQESNSDPYPVAPVRQGSTLRHNYVIQGTHNTLAAQYVSSEVLPQAKALSEGFLGGTVLVNLGSDLVAGQGMNEAVRAAGAAVPGGFGPGAFGAISVGRSRYNSGSHVDVSSLSLMTGFSWGADTSPGHLTLGVFFQYGTGDYDTYNSFGNSASAHGNGDVYHIGGGVKGRMDFANSGNGHFYAEASGSAGRVHNEYSSSDLRDSWGRSAKYESSTSYYGFHVGAG